MKKRRYTHHPDMKIMRYRANLVCMAIQTLSGLGVTVLGVDLAQHQNIIEVADGPRLFELGGESVEQRNDGLVRSVQKSAWLCGCRITWSESR